MFTEPTKGNPGFFDIDWTKNFVQWLAWREWYHAEFGKTFFPQHQTTMFVWPPTSGTAAVAVGDWLRGVREEIQRETPKRGRGTSFAAVPDNFSPWREWDDSLKIDVAEAEIQRRRAWGNSFTSAPVYAWRASIGIRYPHPMASVDYSLPKRVFASRF